MCEERSTGGDAGDPVLDELIRARRSARDAFLGSGRHFLNRARDPFGIAARIREAPLTAMGISAGSGLVLSGLFTGKGARSESGAAGLGLGAIAGFLTRNVVVPSVGRAARRMAAPETDGHVPHPPFPRAAPRSSGPRSA